PVAAASEVFRELRTQTLNENPLENVGIFPIYLFEQLRKIAMEISEGCKDIYKCCGGLEPCFKQHICCGKDVGTIGCKMVYECCNKDVESRGCEYAHKCCGQEIGSPGCTDVCKN
ncbi:13141_t:CDS:2, partial [Racocetra fulgida]